MAGLKRKPWWRSGGNIDSLTDSITEYINLCGHYYANEDTEVLLHQLALDQLRPEGVAEHEEEGLSEERQEPGEVGAERAEGETEGE